MSATPSFAFVVSTAGSVMNATLASPFLRRVVRCVVASQPCGAIEKARSHGIPVVLIDESSPARFCAGLRAQLEEQGIDWVLSFYTRFYAEEFRAAYRDRILNFHPSLLPAFKGMDGFGDAMDHHVKLIGSTVELVKDVMDEGKIVLQSVGPVDPAAPRAEVRHRLFVQQCKALLQVVRWICEGRLEVRGDEVGIRGARYDDVEFAPALDFDEARRFRVPEAAAGRMVTA